MNVTRLPVSNPRRCVARPSASARLVGAAEDLILIATEHEFDRDGVREVAARLKRLAEEMSES